ncbi:hypothetical protein [Teredinibacter franksiae]|uniref:hypothetical protein n=1 Tax=Teredinibacter franksiae TaxID=2761453 RepID=UPI0016267904|nr:hypothetical protein [Teredinibacter franksiae]
MSLALDLQMKKYTDYFIKTTGGQFLWSEFRREAMASYFLYSTIYAVAGVILGAVFGQVFALLVVGSIFCFVGMIGVLTFVSGRVQSVILIENADINKAKYALYLCIYTGAFGCLIVLWSFV